MSPTGQKFWISLDVAYGSLSLFTTVLHNIFLLFHVDMFVSVYKIDKTSFWIGEIVFLVWNSLNDPLFGWISDRKYLSSSMGKDHSKVNIILKRISALNCTGPLFAVSFLSFWVPWTYPSVQFVVCLCLYDGFLTMVDLHHSALLADIAVSADRRTKLNSRSSLFSIIGTASVFFSYAVWNKENLSSFRTFCFILSFVSLLGFWIMTTLLRQIFMDQSETLKQKSEDMNSNSLDLEESDQKKLKNFVCQLSSQTNFIWFAVMNLIQVFHCHFNSNFFPLFLENLLGDAISPGFGSFLLGISFVAPHINNLYFLTLCRRYGVYSVIRLLFTVKLVLSVVMFLAGPNHIWLLCLFIASNRVFTEGTCKLLNLVISDLVDEDYVLHRRSQAVSALMFGTTALLSKPGQTLAPLIGTWFLAQQTGHDIFQSGRDLGSIKQVSEMGSSSSYREGCFNLLVYVPIVCAILQLLVWAQFTLHGRRLRSIKAARSDTSFSHV